MDQIGSLEKLKHGRGSSGGRKRQENQKGYVHLLQELLEDIYKRLVLSDQIRFGCICKPWLSIALKKPHPPVTEPWLLLCGGLDNEFRCLSDQRVYKFDKIPQDCKFLGPSSSNGLVLTTTHPQLDGGQISFLVNPILNNFQITLTEHFSAFLPFLSIKKLLVVRTRPTCGDSIVNIIITLCSVGYLAVSILDGFSISRAASYDDFIFYNGKIYALESKRPGFQLHAFSIVEQTRKSLPLHQIIHLVHLLHEYIVQGIVTEDPGCLVESTSGDLLIVTRQTDERKCLVGFEVFKLQLIDGTAHATKLQSLGGQAMFLGMDGCISLPVGEFSIFEESHIYFIGFASESTQLGNGVYSLKDGCIKGFPYLSSIFCPPRSFWFVPTTEDRIVNLDWLKED